MVLKSKTLSVSIAASHQAVYRFASNPENLPQWAPAFCKAIRNTGGEWVVESPEGPVIVRFADTNPFGVLDHTVELPSGREINSAMRVIPNGAGSDVIFTLFQTANMSDDRFVEDARLVENDLRTLRRIVESQ